MPRLLIDDVGAASPSCVGCCVFFVRQIGILQKELRTKDSVVTDLQRRMKEDYSDGDHREIQYYKQTAEDTQVAL